MKQLRITLALVFIAAALAVAVEVRGQQTSAPDNSKQNSHVIQTADNQPNDKADRLTAAQVRKAIMADKGLSVYAHNVKVIVVAGKVTLEGPVHTEVERQQLLSDVATVVESENIVNKITIS